MRSRWKHITALLLVLAMAVSGSYVFAGTDAASVDDETQAALDVTNEAEAADEALAEEALLEEALPEEPAIPEENVPGENIVSEPDTSLAIQDEGETVETMAVWGGTNIILSAPTVNYTSTAVPVSEDLQYPSGSSPYTVATVTVGTSGKLWVDAACTTNASLYIGRYDANTGNGVYGSDHSYLSAGVGKNGIGGVDVTSGTYCIGIQATQSGIVCFRPYVFSYAPRTLPANIYMLTSGYKGSYNDSKALFQIRPSKNGYIRVFGAKPDNGSTAGYVTLLNASKKAVSDRLLFSSGSGTSYVAFGVKKGVTYYLQASGFQVSSANQYSYGIQYRNYAGALRANTTKKKAKNLKRKAKYIATVMPATGKAGNQWYKFKVTKKRATQVKIDATYIKSGKTTVTVYCGKKKVGTTTLAKGKINTLKIYSYKDGKAKKGTYYVKISKSAKANGQYRIRYVK